MKQKTLSNGVGYDPGNVTDKSLADLYLLSVLSPGIVAGGELGWKDGASVVSEKNLIVGSSQVVKPVSGDWTWMTLAQDSVLTACPGPIRNDLPLSGEGGLLSQRCALQR